MRHFALLGRLDEAQPRTIALGAARDQQRFRALRYDAARGFRVSGGWRDTRFCTSIGRKRELARTQWFESDRVSSLDIESDYLLGSMPGQPDRLTPRTASEVENNLAGNLIPDGWSKQRLELAAAHVAPRGFNVVPLLPIQNCRG
jgi:hypothetical protein